jgi:mRNA-degrading endonuclease HigB of HigAB toxin-antitoxin module
MRVRVITEESIWEYCKSNARAVPSFLIFLKKLEVCDWNDLNDVKDNFPSMRIVGDCPKNRIVFDVAFIGTHTEYDKVDACTVQKY